MVTAWKVCLIIALVLTFLGTMLTVFALSTDHWVDVSVNRTALFEQVGNNNNSKLAQNLRTNSLYFSRHRGLFRTCYPDSASEMLAGKKEVVGNICLKEAGLKTSKDEDIIDGYKTRTHLLRALIAFLLSAVLMYMIVIILGVAGASLRRVSLIRATGILLFFGAVFAAAGMALFSIVQYLENQKIDMEEFPAGYNSMLAHKELQEVVESNLGYSLIVGWISLGPVCVATVLTLCAASVAHRKRAQRTNDLQSRYYYAKDNKAASEAKDNDSFYSSSLQRNPAYLHIERSTRIFSPDTY